MASPDTWGIPKVLLHVFGAIARIVDVLFLLVRPRLLGPYLDLVRSRLRSSPYRWPRAYQDVAGVKASGQSLDELVYGEVPLFVGVAVLALAGVRRGSKVLDIGAGRGRLLLAARWLGAEARGIELVKDHVLIAARAIARAGGRLDIGDGLTEDLTGVDCVFINWTGFASTTVERLSERLATLPAGTRVVVVTKPIVHEAFAIDRKFYAVFTWGIERVWIYARR